MARYAISDIHGCNKTFLALLDRIQLTTTDQLFLLGDYIHRGPDSIGVIENILRMQGQGYKVHCLRGNHEEMALEDLDRLKLNPNAQMPTYDSFVRELMNQYGEIPDAIYGFIHQLQTCFKEPDYLLVHAGFDFVNPDPFLNVWAMTWIRSWHQNIDYQALGDRSIIHGHTPIEPHVMDKQFERLDTKRYLDIDGGCVFATPDNFIPGFGFLCAFDLDQQKLTRQACIDC
jgi:serine/threonine protein phosphatase 1